MDNERVTSDAPHNGARHHRGDALPPLPQRATGLAGAHTVKQVLGPIAHTTRARESQATGPGSTAHPEGGQPGEGQRLTPYVPRNGATQPPPPPGTPSRHPNSVQHRLARAHAVGPVLGSHDNTTRARETRATGPGCPPPGTGSRERKSA